MYERLRCSPYFAHSRCHFQDALRVTNWNISLAATHWLLPNGGYLLSLFPVGIEFHLPGAKTQSVLYEVFSTESWHFNHPPPSLLSTGSKHSQQIQGKKKSSEFLRKFACFFFRICMFCPQVLNHTPTQASSIQPMSSSSPGLHVSNPAEARPFTLNCQASIYTRGCCWRGSLSFTKAV